MAFNSFVTLGLTSLSLSFFEKKKKMNLRGLNKIIHEWSLACNPTTQRTLFIINQSHSEIVNSSGADLGLPDSKSSAPSSSP